MYSKLWRDIIRDYFSGNNISEHTLDNFREVGELNNKIVNFANCSIFYYYQMVLFKNKTREIDYSHG